MDARELPSFTTLTIASGPLLIWIDRVPSPPWNADSRLRIAQLAGRGDVFGVAGFTGGAETAGLTVGFDTDGTTGVMIFDLTRVGVNDDLLPATTSTCVLASL